MDYDEGVPREPRGVNRNHDLPPLSPVKVNLNFNINLFFRPPHRDLRLLYAKSHARPNPSKR